MNISKLTITALESAPSSIRKTLNYTKVNPDIDIAARLIKDRLYLRDDMVEISQKNFISASKKNHFDVLKQIQPDNSGKESFYRAKYQIENSLTTILQHKGI